MSDLERVRDSLLEDDEHDVTLGPQLPLNRCPHCGIANPHLQQEWGVTRTKTHDDRNPRRWAAYVCSSCGGMIIAGAPSGSGDKVMELYPDLRTPSAALPERAQHYLREALESLNSPSAAIMVAASAVDEMLKAKEYKEGSLYKRIGEAENDNLITGEMAAWAHDVRLDANDQRHADQDAGLPEPEDARRSVDFAEALGDFLFVLPARVKRGRDAAEEAREQRENQS